MWFDPHTHHQFSGFNTLESLRNSGCIGVLNLAYIPVRPSGPDTFNDVFKWLCEAETERFARAGLKAYSGVGIHPRCIPKRKLEETLKIVEEYLSTNNALTLGEIGVENCSTLEFEILHEQLKIASRLDKPVIIHTPRRLKLQATNKILNIAKKSRVNPELTIIDHASRETIEVIISEGFKAGLTIQEDKLNIKDVIDIIAQHGCENIILNSDAGREPSNPLAVFEAVNTLKRMDLVKEALKISYENPIKTLKLK